MLTLFAVADQDSCKQRFALTAMMAKPAGAMHGNGIPLAAIEQAVSPGMSTAKAALNPH